jgi:hypothetical protein
MTRADFIAYYPQFTNFQPVAVMDDAIRQANARFSDFDEVDIDYARRLFTAHILTLYAVTALPSGSSMAQIASTGRALQQKISSKRVDDVQVSYATSSGSSASSSFASLGETTFGLELLTLLKLYSRSRYIP